MVHVYYHIYAIDGVEFIINEQLNLIKKHFDFPYILNVGISIADENKSISNILDILDKSKIRDIRAKGHEFTTLELIEKDKENFGDSDYILYIHTKGASKQLDKQYDNIISWRHLMNYFNIEKCTNVFKILEKNGLVFESPSIHENKVPTWIEAFVRERGYSINVQASALVAEYLGNDLSKVANELEKMMLNVSSGKEISTQDIQNNIGISKDYNVFELQNAITRKDAYKVNQIINYFADNPKNNPIQLLLGALNAYFTKILKYHYTGDKSPQTLASALGIAPFFVREYEQAARNYSKEKVFRIISYLRDYDLKIKGVDASANTEQSELMKELMFKIIH